MFILQKSIETTKSYVNLKKASDANNKLQILLKVMQRSDETTSFSNSLKTEIDSGNHIKISSIVNHDEMITKFVYILQIKLDSPLIIYIYLLILRFLFP